MPTEEAWQERCRNAVQNGSNTFIAHHPSRIHKDILAYECTMYNVISDSGEESFWSFAHDISERMRYEAQIKRLNRIMDTTINNLPAGIVVKEINNDFRYVYRNRESYNRDHFSDNPVGKNDYDFYPPIVAEKKRQEDIEVAATGKGLHWIAEGKDRNGNLIILDKRKIKVDGDELSSPIIVSIEWDITELEMIKRELQSSKEKAEMSDNLKSAFLANMSHEIRTPLNAIVGFSHLITESDDAEERKTYYQIVEANNERLLQLINEILDLSKIESGTIEFSFGLTSLHNLCQEIHDAHIFRTPEGVQLVYEPSDESLRIETDKNRVFQVISNLIGNAVKFTKEGSIKYGYELVDGQIVFHVTDTGTGIEPEKVGRVFERFAKLNNHAQGTGLGLSICKSIVERLGGQISVSSIVGVGTTFTFTLPYSTQETPKEVDSEMKTVLYKEEVPQSGNGISANEGTGKEKIHMTKQICILIAEDTDSNYDLLNAILGKQYRLVRANDGMEAVLLYDEKSAFLANMSHEIRTPLNAIVGFSHLITESDDAEERKTYYQIVEANNERLLQLINEILDLSKIESGTIEFSFGLTSLHNLCQEIHDAHIFRTPEGVQLVYEPSDESLRIETDKNRVFQVISNLIGNAVKFTKEGSIKYGYELVDGQIVFHVTDTGTGIEPEKVGRVFERFAKLNNHAQGTGLGLSICKSIVERLGGQISVSSIVGVGTTFTFTLPYSTQETPKEVDSEMKTVLYKEEVPQSGNGISANEGTGKEKIHMTKQICILIAEDTDSNYDLLNAILGKQYRLVRANDGMEAVLLYDEVKPDLILMDIKMPNLDGLEATKIIRELSATVPIIAQSAFAYEHDVKAAMEAGCNDFIAKPIAQSKLKEVINKWLTME